MTESLKIAFALAVTVTVGAGAFFAISFLVGLHG